MAAKQFTLINATYITAECEKCGHDMFFTAIYAREGEGRFGTCAHCNHTENTFVNSCRECRHKMNCDSDPDTCGYWD